MPPLDSLSIFKAQPGATLLLSPDWVIVGASDDYLAATLTERAVIVGQHIFDAFPETPETPEANAVANVRASLETVLATKQPHDMAPQHYDVPDRTRPGGFVERHWQPRHTPVLDAQGQVQFIIQSVQDITASRQAERQLRESQAREQAARAVAERERAELQRVFAEAPVAMGLLRGPDFVVEWANVRMGRIWGRSLDQVVGRPHFVALPDLAGQGFEAVFASVLQTGESGYFHEVLVTIAQTQQSYQGYFNITYQPVYDELDHITGLICSAVEVTDQVRARQQVQTLNEELRASNEEYLATNAALGQTQKELQQLNQDLEARVQQRTQQAEVARTEAEVQRQRFHDMLMLLPAHVAVHEGPDQVVTLVNPGYQSLAPGRALLGLPIREAWPELVTHGILDVLSGVYQTGEPFIATELPVHADFTRTGLLEQVYYNFFFLALRDAQGHINGVLNFSYDVTASVLARQQVQDLNEELAAINEELTATNEKLNNSNTQLTRTNVDLDTFVYTASHDLKAPISNIESITLALRDTLPAEVQQDEMMAHLLDLLEHTTTRFQLTIGQLTDLSKLQLAHAGPAEPVPLAAVIEAVRLDLAPAIVEANAQLTVAVAPDLRVSFSPANLRSAIYNLLSNAVKYRALARPAQVQVRAYSAGPRVVLEVQDNGLGLNAHQQSRLFGLFQRLHTHVEGTGVGLYITKRLVENGGGTIAVESQVDVGTILSALNAPSIALGAFLSFWGTV
jgi:signal transduction histidine kinase/PAS domain-containing protein